MKKLFVTLLVVLAVSSVSACGKSRQDFREAQAASVAVTPAATSGQRSLPSAAEVQAETRKDRIKTLKERLAWPNEMSLKEQIARESSNPVCELRDLYDNLASIFGEMDGPGRELTWADLGASEEAVRGRFQKIGEEYSRELVRLLKLSYAERKKLGNCGIGQGTLVLAEVDWMVDFLSRNLEEIDKSQGDFGMSAKEIREAVRKNFAAQLDERASAKDQSADQGSAGLEYRNILRQATEFPWHFKPEEIGLK